MEREYYLGLDVGTNSVGYSVTDLKYDLLKFKGEPMWGAHVFDEAKTCAERRAFRTARRRLHRRQQRVKLVQEIFAKEIFKIDPRFFIRIEGSTLLREDVPVTDANLLFNDAKYHDKDYHMEYPTIHHLLCELMESDEPHDVRLVYLAVAWLVAHRGHFLNEVDKDNVEAVMNFHEVYQDFQNFMERKGFEKWHCDEDVFKDILVTKMSVSDKEKAFQKVILDGEKLVSEFEENINQKGFLKLLSGGKIKVEKIFLTKEYEENISLCFRDKEDLFLANISKLGEEAEWIDKLKKIYDWSLLKKALNGKKSVSKAKVDIYEQHRKDLKNLKHFVKKYIPEKYGKLQVQIEH